MHSTLEKYNSLMWIRLRFHYLVFTYSKTTEQMGKYQALWFPWWRKWPLFVFHRTKNIYQGKTFRGVGRAWDSPYVTLQTLPPSSQTMHACWSGRLKRQKSCQKTRPKSSLRPKYRAEQIPNSFHQVIRCFAVFIHIMSVENSTYMPRPPLAV